MGNHFRSIAGIGLLLLALAVLSPPSYAQVEARVRAKKVFLRDVPEEAAASIGTLSLDTRVFVIKESGNWTFVFVPLLDERGWVLTNTLEKISREDEKDKLVVRYSNIPLGIEQNIYVMEGEEQDGEVSKLAEEDSSSKPSVQPRDQAEQEQEDTKQVEDRLEEGADQVALVPSLSPEDAEQFSPEFPPIALISASDVNLRRYPDLRSEVIARLSKGTKVYLVSVSGPWYHVSVPSIGKRGYVFGTFLYQLKNVVITGENVNLRREPSLSSEVVAVLKEGENLVMKGELKDWLWVVSAKTGYEGWVSKQYAKITPPMLPKYKVIGDKVNFRKTPRVDAEVIGQLELGEEVTVLGRERKWSLVIDDGVYGWVYNEYLIPEEEYRFAAGRSIGDKLVKRGLDLRGIPYRWGGSSPKGFDCSGLVYYILRTEFGLTNLPRRASEQYYKMGTAVDKEDLRPGDLVFFSTYKPGPSHVGVYIGDGNFIHASSGGGKVIISSLSQPYYKKRFIGARRITEKDLIKFAGK